MKVIKVIVGYNCSYRISLLLVWMTGIVCEVNLLLTNQMVKPCKKANGLHSGQDYAAVGSGLGVIEK